MKLYNLLPILLIGLFGNLGYSQTNEMFAAYGTSGSVSLVSGLNYNITISGFQGNPRSYGQPNWLKTDVAIGDKVFLSCNQYTVVSISSTAPNLVMVVSKTDAPTPAPTNSQPVALLREYLYGTSALAYALPQSGDGNGGSIAGIPISLQACIRSHYEQKSSILLGQALTSALEVAFTSGAAVPATSVATVDGFRLAKNNGGLGTLYSWDGSAWVAVGANGESTTFTATTTIHNLGTLPNLQLEVIDGSITPAKLSQTYLTSEIDGSTTNEIQNLSLTGDALSISSGTGVTLPVVGITAGTNITTSTTAGVVTINTPTKVTDGTTLDGTGATLDPFRLGQNGATLGQINKWNGTTWVAQDDSDGCTQTITVTANGWTVGQAVRWDGTAWVLGTSATSGSLPFFLITEKPDANTLKINSCKGGYVVFSSPPAIGDYYLQTDGTVTTSIPASGIVYSVYSVTENNKIYVSMDWLNQGLSGGAASVAYAPVAPLTATSVGGALDEVASYIAADADQSITNELQVTSIVGDNLRLSVNNADIRLRDLNYKHGVATIADVATYAKESEKMIVVTDLKTGGTFTKIEDGVGTVDNYMIVQDATGTKYKRQFDGTINPKWFGAVGDGVTDDAAAIQACLNYANANNVSVMFDGGEYRINSEIDAKNNITIDLNKSTIIYSGNTASIKMRSNSTLKNGILDCSQNSLDPNKLGPGALHYTGKALQFIGQSGGASFGISNPTLVQNIEILNSTVDIVDERRFGTGIHMESTASNAPVSFTSFENVRIVGFKKGVHMYAPIGFITTNFFTTLKMNDCYEFIHLDLTTGTSIASNRFNGTIQPSTAKETSRRAIICNGDYNTFDVFVYDWKTDFTTPDEVDDDESKYTIEFGPLAKRNRVFSTGAPSTIYDPQPVFQAQEVHIYTNTEVSIDPNTFSPPISEEAGSFNGMQDNTLALADKKYVVTTSGAAFAGAATVSDLFRIKSYEGVYGVTTVAATDFAVTIDLLESQVRGSKGLGVVFFDELYPDSVIIERSSNGTVWDTITAQDGRSHVHFIPRGNIQAQFRYLRFSFHSNTAKQLRIDRIYGNTHRANSSAFVDIDGATVYGDIQEVKITTKTGAPTETFLLNKSDGKKVMLTGTGYTAPKFRLPSVALGASLTTVEPGWILDLFNNSDDQLDITVLAPTTVLGVTMPYTVAIGSTVRFTAIDVNTWVISPVGTVSVGGGTYTDNSVLVGDGTSTAVTDGLVYTRATDKLGIGVTPVNNDLALEPNTARLIGMERRTSAGGTPGLDLTVTAGGARLVPLSTDAAGGDLLLVSGVSTGTASSGIQFKVPPAGSTGTTDNNPTTRMRITDAGIQIGSTVPVSKFQVTGSQGGTITIHNTAASLALTVNHFTVVLNNANVLCTVSLPNPATTAGRWYRIVNRTGFSPVLAGTFNTYIPMSTAASANTIAVDQSHTFMSDGTSWYRVQ